MSTHSIYVARAEATQRQNFHQKHITLIFLRFAIFFFLSKIETELTFQLSRRINYYSKVRLFLSLRCSTLLSALYMIR